jgi:hemerythrin-like domain-containing protein
VLNTPAEPLAVLETRLVHNVHRQATTLLVEAAGRPSVPAAALAEVRDFLVAHLHHHHESEDHDLWPMITAIAPQAAEGLAALSVEHHQLDAALDALDKVAVVDGADRAVLREAATAVRDLVLHHLEDEEPLLFPALRDQVSPEAWTDFSKKVIATSPTLAAHLLVGFFDRVGTPEEVALVLPPIPEPILAAMRQQAQATFEALGETA